MKTPRKVTLRSFAFMLSLATVIGFSNDLQAAQLLGRIQARSCDCNDNSCAGGCSSTYSSCDQSCPQCDEGGCVLEVKQVEEEKTCYKTEQKAICIPKVRWPWQEECPPTASESRTVNVLKKHKYKCTKCAYTWKEAEPDIENKTTNRPAEILQMNKQPADSFGFARQSDGTFEVFGVSEPPLGTPMKIQHDVIPRNGEASSEYGSTQSTELNYSSQAISAENDLALPVPYRILDGNQPTFPPSAYPRGMMSGQQPIGLTASPNPSTIIHSSESLYQSPPDSRTDSTTTFSNPITESYHNGSVQVENYIETPASEGAASQAKDQEGSDLQRHSPLPAPPAESNFPGTAMSFSDNATSKNPIKIPVGIPESASYLITDDSSMTSRNAEPLTIKTNMEHSNADTPTTSMTFSDKIPSTGDARLSSPDISLSQPHVSSTEHRNGESFEPGIPSSKPTSPDKESAEPVNSSRSSPKIEASFSDDENYSFDSPDTTSIEIDHAQTTSESTTSESTTSDSTVLKPNNRDFEIGEREFLSPNAVPPKRDAITQAPALMEIEAAPNPGSKIQEQDLPFKGHSILVPIAPVKDDLGDAFLIRPDATDNPQQPISQTGLQSNQAPTPYAPPAKHDPVVANFSSQPTGQVSNRHNQDKFLIRTVNFETHPKPPSNGGATVRFSDQQSVNQKLKKTPSHIKFSDQNSEWTAPKRQNSVPQTGWIPLSDK